MISGRELNIKIALIKSKNGISTRFSLKNMLIDYFSYSFYFCQKYKGDKVLKRAHKLSDSCIFYITNTCEYTSFP